MTAETFDVLDPATGELVGRHRTTTEFEVTGAVRRARDCAAWWAGLGFAGRARRLDAWRRRIARGAPELAGLISREMGKPHADAMLEIAMGLEHLAWASRNAARVLGPRAVRPSALTINQKAVVEYRPLGVVGVIGPWNYPVFTPLGSLAGALAAGNTVVFKPSEYTPGVGQWLGDAFREVVPEHPVLQVVTGDGVTGAALCRAGVDKIGFTGSTATGRAVLAACAATLTPVLMECGGKDALLVDADADLAAAADAAVWGGLSNAGQTCLAVERIYVHAAIHDEFVDRVVALARKVKPGAQIGPITMPSQVKIIERHIRDALDRGGRAVLGGTDAVRDRFVSPTILVDVPDDSAAVTEETFGPVLVVTKVEDMDEAVARANNVRYGLGATVFSRRNGRAIAGRLRSGAVSVNAFVAHASVPSLPLGGIGDSGFGRVHGADGLREFAYARATTVQRFPSPLPLTTFRRTAGIDALVRVLVGIRHGRGVPR
ncbi:acyl-CoA reductase-like NAD-dependent aldehyde dehydrogenase [Amycolatopsis lexingtonensis]|uniref:Aldehyde dehydrogenase n=2 Tax=Amycolatopsis lexingtonensis TaxID=218822 RepID=A0ABR9HYP2_9PSEU|nr:aldehyde dehydrogenase family protein [Amycolatopsis lexingtonensis]MBE1496025.1 acyl-CoA reductase-like NAD-dependent aldehyde dehydrogenase [Amycolatopsis lexingtonensis]